MRKDKCNTKQPLGKSTCWIGRHFKPIWENADVSEAKNKAFELCNRIRQDEGLPPYTESVFDEGWQYRIVFHQRYHTARVEFINLVSGWW